VAIISLTATPYENLTQGERELFVYLYEEKHPEQASIMNDFTEGIPEGYGFDVNNKLHSFDDDNINIRFMVYASPEPEKTLFLQYAPQVEVIWDCECTPNWGYYEPNEPDGYKDGKYRLHIDLTGYVIPPSSKRVPECDNPRGPYLTLFHEFGHALDDLYMDNQQDGLTVTQSMGLNDKVVEEVKKDVEDKIRYTWYLNGGKWVLKPEQVSEIASVICGPTPDKLPSDWTQDMRDAYNQTLAGYNNNHKNSLKYGAWDVSSSVTYECVTDVYWDVTDNQITYSSGYAHRPDGNGSYWYNSDGTWKHYPASEFWAENFSYAMTYSPYGQEDATNNVFPESQQMYQDKVQEMRDSIIN